MKKNLQEKLTRELNIRHQQKETRGINTRNLQKETRGINKRKLQKETRGINKRKLQENQHKEFNRFSEEENLQEKFTKGIMKKRSKQEN